MSLIWAPPSLWALPGRFLVCFPLRGRDTGPRTACPPSEGVRGLCQTGAHRMSVLGGSVPGRSGQRKHPHHRCYQTEVPPGSAALCPSGCFRGVSERGHSLLTPTGLLSGGLRAETGWPQPRIKAHATELHAARYASSRHRRPGTRPAQHPSWATSLPPASLDQDRETRPGHLRSLPLMGKEFLLKNNL